MDDLGRAPARRGDHRHTGRLRLGQAEAELLHRRRNDGATRPVELSQLVVLHMAREPDVLRCLRPHPVELRTLPRHDESFPRAAKGVHEHIETLVAQYPGDSEEVGLLTLCGCKEPAAHRRMDYPNGPAGQPRKPLRGEAGIGDQHVRPPQEASVVRTQCRDRRAEDRAQRRRIFPWWFGCETDVEVDVGGPCRVALIAGYSPFRHVGDDAIVRAHIRTIADQLPHCEPVLFGERPQALAERFGATAAPSVHAYLMAGSEGRHRGLPFFRRVGPRSLRLLLAARARATGRSRAGPPAAASFLDELAACDALLAATAGSLTSEFRRAGLWPHAVTLLVARALGLRVLVSGVTIGPLRGVADRLLLAAAMRGAEVIVVRDRALSATALRRLLVRGARIVEASDPAIALAPASGDEIDAALAGAGIAPGEPFAALSAHPGQHPAGTIDALARTVERLHLAHGVPTVFLPMVLAGEHDDREAARAVRRRLEHADALRVLDPLPADAVVSGVIGRARVAFGTRYHLAVFAAAHGVPTIGLYAGDYTRLKFRGLAGLARSRVTTLELPGESERLPSTVEAALANGAHPRAESAGLPAVEALRAGVGSRLTRSARAAVPD